MVIAKNKGHFATLLQAYAFCRASSAGQHHVGETSWHLSNPQQRSQTDPHLHPLKRRIEQMNQIVANLAAFRGIFEGFSEVGAVFSAVIVPLFHPHLAVGAQHTRSLEDEGVLSGSQLLAVKTNNVHSQLGPSAGWMGASGWGVPPVLTVNKR